MKEDNFAVCICWASSSCSGQVGRLIGTPTETPAAVLGGKWRGKTFGVSILHGGAGITSDGPGLIVRLKWDEWTWAFGCAVDDVLDMCLSRFMFWPPRVEDESAWVPDSNGMVRSACDPHPDGWRKEQWCQRSDKKPLARGVLRTVCLTFKMFRTTILSCFIRVVLSHMHSFLWPWLFIWGMCVCCHRHTRCISQTDEVKVLYLDVLIRRYQLFRQIKLKFQVWFLEGTNKNLFVLPIRVSEQKTFIGVVRLQTTYFYV